MQELSDSPFHEGEKKIQQQLGVSEKMERFGRKVIRKFMPDQHRNFYEKLPYFFVGHADKNGWPWASVLFGDEGFIQSPDNTHLQINGLPVFGDPLREAVVEGRSLGFLGIELGSRRRNRLTGTIQSKEESGFVFQVNQAFGNCPKYIQARTAVPRVVAEEPVVTELTVFDEQAKRTISTSDTFFVASQHPASDGVDVSHRGGKSGFVRVDSDTKITIPDYQGNFHFNTLGNFEVNPKAGLLFVDFDRGDLLLLTGKVEILWDSSEQSDFDGAERLWTFEVDHGVRIENAVPFTFQLDSVSPHLDF